MKTWRLNAYVAKSSALSRRAADEAIASRRVTVDRVPATLGQTVSETAMVELDGRQIKPLDQVTVAFNKPIGYICSRRQQGKAPTIYQLLPTEFQHLRSVGRLDKDSSGLLLLTNDGSLAQRLSHPSFGKIKRYQVEVKPTLSEDDATKLQEGVELPDGTSRLSILERSPRLIVGLQEGRNRQIRRTFAALGYEVIELKRLSFGPVELGSLPTGACRTVENGELT